MQRFCLLRLSLTAWFVFITFNRMANSLCVKTNASAIYPGLLTSTALAYLALPNILFVLGWCRPVYALILAASILVLFFRTVIGSFSATAPPSSYRAAGSRIWVMCVLVALIAIWILMSGMTGDCRQQIDYIVRNAMFASLVRCDWPLIFSDGSAFVYYLSSLLPPALVARIHPEGSFPLYCLGAWCFFGVLLMCLLMERKIGKRVLLFLVFLLLVGNVGAYIQNLAGLFGKGLWSYPAYVLFYSVGSAVQLQTTFHHVIPVWVVLALYFSNALSWSKTVCVSSLVLLASPLASLGLAAFFLYTLMIDRDKAIKRILSLLKEPSFYCACLLAVTAVAFFSSNEGDAAFRWVWESIPLDGILSTGKSVFWAFCSGGLTIALILLLAYATGNFKNRLLWFVAGMLFLLPILVIGSKVNELVFKASCIPYWVLSFLLTQWFVAAKLKERLLIASFVLLSSGGTYEMITYCCSGLSMPSEKRMRTDWQWHLYHPEHRWHSHFVGDMKSSLFFYNRAGESAERMLFWFRRDNCSDREQTPPPTPWRSAAQENNQSLENEQGM